VEQVTSREMVIDDRPLRRRLLPVVGTGVAAIVGTVYLRAVDPNVPGHYPGCPSQMWFGIDCPGCGGMRGTYDLLHGDVAGMLDHNVLLLVAWPLAVIAFSVWVFRAWTGRRPRVDVPTQARRSRMWVWVLIAVLAFGVVRNFVPYLGSGAG
jgi:hypothetical protein